MTRTLEVSAEVVVAAPASVVYALVSDPTQTPRWSPENTAAILDSPGPLQVGDAFDGRNRRGRARWVTRSVVTTADPDRCFAFQVRFWGVRKPRLRVANATWTYRLEPVGDATRVTEIWHDDRRWPDAFAAVIDPILTRGKQFAAFQERNLRASLGNLKELIESG